MMTAEANKSGKTISNRANALFNPTDGAAEMFVIPESQMEHGSHPNLHTDPDESRFFATRVVSHPDHDEILVRYYSAAKRSTVARDYEVMEADEPLTPKVVVEKGPKRFQTPISHSHHRAHDLDSRVDASIVADRYDDAAVHGVFRIEDVLQLMTRADLSFDIPQQILTSIAHYGLNLYVYVFIYANESVRQLRHAITSKRIRVHIVIMMAVDDCGTTNARDETELGTPVKVSWTGKARSKAWGYFIDFGAESYTLTARTLERQKTNVVASTVEGTGASVGTLNRYVGGGITDQTQMNRAVDKAFQRVQAEVRDALSGAKTHPRSDDK